MIRRLLKLWIINSFLIANVCSLPIVWEVQSQDEDYIKRSKYEKLLSKILEQQKNTVLSVYGPYFTGKKEITKAIVHKRYSKYDIVFWFDGNQDIENQLAKFAYAVAIHYGTEDDIKHVSDLPSWVAINYAKDKLRILNLNWLLIFTNIDNYLQFKKYLPPHRSQELGHVIVTSRYKPKLKNKVLVRKLERDEAIKYIQRVAAVNDEAMQDLIMEYTQRHPLLLKYVCIQIKNDGLASLRQINDLLSGSSFNGSNNFKRIVKHEVKSFKKKHHAVVRWLNVCAVMGGSNVLKKYIYDLFEEEDAIALLKIMRESIVMFTDRGGHKRSFNLNSVAKETILELMEGNDFRQAIEDSIKILNNYLYIDVDTVSDHFTIGPKHWEFLDHIRSLWNNAKKIDYSHPHLTQIMVAFMEILITQNVYKLNELEGVINDIQKYARLANIEDHCRALYYINYGLYYRWKFNDLAESKKLFNKALKLLRKKEVCPSLQLRALQNILYTELYTGTYHTCKKCLDDALKILNKAKSIFSLTYFFWQQLEYYLFFGLNQNAKVLLDQLMDPLTLRKYSLTYKDVVNNTIWFNFRQQNYEKASKLINKHHETITRIYGERGRWYYYTRSLKIITQAYLDKNISEKSIELIKEAAAYEETRSKKYNYYKAASYFILALAYHITKDYQEAYDAYNLALDTYKEMNPNHECFEIWWIYRQLAILGSEAGSLRLSRYALSALWHNYDKKIATKENYIEAVRYYDKKNKVIPAHWIKVEAPEKL